MKNIKSKFASQREAIQYLKDRGWFISRRAVAGVWMIHYAMSHLNVIRKSGSAWVIEAV